MAIKLPSIYSFTTPTGCVKPQPKNWFFICYPLLREQNWALSPFLLSVYTETAIIHQAALLLQRTAFTCIRSMVLTFNLYKLTTRRKTKFHISGRKKRKRSLKLIPPVDGSDLCSLCGPAVEITNRQKPIQTYTHERTSILAKEHVTAASITTLSKGFRIAQ